jgi:hypothetical protein
MREDAPETLKSFPEMAKEMARHPRQDLYQKHICSME